MAKLVWAIFCERFEMVNGKASLIGMLEEILVRSVPTAQRQLFLVVRIVVDPGEKVVFDVRVRAPSGRVVAEIEEPPRAAQRGLATHNAVFGFDGLPLPELGKYHFEISVNGKKLHRVSILVNAMQSN